MASKTLRFLPTIFQTDTNKKFLSATIDQLVSEPQFKRINGYIGRSFAPTYKSTDNYVLEQSVERQNYQLEPSVVVKNSSKNITFFSSYPDLLNKIKFYGGSISDHNRLFENEYYTFNPLIDFDKFVNFGQYYWLPNGPDSVRVFASSVEYERTYSITRSNNNYTFSGVPHRNPTLILARGGTYTFDVNQLGNKFWIQTELGISGTLKNTPTISSREILGVENNGNDYGVITFIVPQKGSQDSYLGLESLGVVDCTTTLRYSDIQSKLLSEVVGLGGFDGLTTQLDGKSFVFVDQDKISNAGAPNDLTDPNSYEAAWTVKGKFITEEWDEWGWSFGPDIWDQAQFGLGTTVPQEDRVAIWKIKLLPASNILTFSGPVSAKAGDRIIQTLSGASAIVIATVHDSTTVTVKYENGRAFVTGAGPIRIDNESLTVYPILTPNNDYIIQITNRDSSFDGSSTLKLNKPVSLSVGDKIVQPSSGALAVVANAIVHSDTVNVTYDSTTTFVLDSSAIHIDRDHFPIYVTNVVNNNIKRLIINSKTTLNAGDIITQPSTGASAQVVTGGTLTYAFDVTYLTLQTFALDKSVIEINSVSKPALFVVSANDSYIRTLVLNTAPLIPVIAGHKIIQSTSGASATVLSVSSNTIDVQYDSTTEFTVDNSRLQIDREFGYFIATLSNFGVRKIHKDQKVYIKSGRSNANKQYYNDYTDVLKVLPVFTSDLDVLYYQDSTNSAIYGEIKLVDVGLFNIDVEKDILGRQNYTSPNGVTFTNGLKVAFDSYTTPSFYKSREFYVEGVGNSISLTPVDYLVTTESYHDTVRTLNNGMDLPDYFVINRSSIDLNGWSRNNRWFHKDVISATARYNDPSVSATYDQAYRAIRPIIEFDPNIQLFNHGRTGKAPVNILDNSTTDAFSELQGQSVEVILTFSDAISVSNGSTIYQLADDGVTVTASAKVVEPTRNSIKNSIKFSGTITANAGDVISQALSGTTAVIEESVVDSRVVNVTYINGNSFTLGAGPIRINMTQLAVYPVTSPTSSVKVMYNMPAFFESGKTIHINNVSKTGIVFVTYGPVPGGNSVDVVFVLSDLITAPRGAKIFQKSDDDSTIIAEAVVVKSAYNTNTVVVAYTMQGAFVQGKFIYINSTTQPSLTYVSSEILPSDISSVLLTLSGVVSLPANSVIYQTADDGVTVVASATTISEVVGNDTVSAIYNLPSPFISGRPIYINSTTQPTVITFESATGSQYGMPFCDGLRIIFAADRDLTVRNKIYTVQLFQTHNDVNGDPIGVPQLNLLQSPDGEVYENDAVVVVNGAYQGTNWWFNGMYWNQSQTKTYINQPPYFDVFDHNNESLAVNYNLVDSSNFRGTKIFGYKESTAGVVDSVLGIKLSYRNFQTQGDMEFSNYYDTDLVVSKVQSTTGSSTPVNINTASLHQIVDRETVKKRNVWSTVSELSKQYQNISNVYDGNNTIKLITFNKAITVKTGDLLIQPSTSAEAIVTESTTGTVITVQYKTVTQFSVGDNVGSISINGIPQEVFDTITGVLDITYVMSTLSNDYTIFNIPVDSAPDEDSIPYIKVYVNNQFLDRSNWYKVDLAIVIKKPLVINDKVDILVYSKQSAGTDLYQVPLNLDYNAQNVDLESVTLGQVRNHLVEIGRNCTDISGNIIGANNLRDLYVKNVGGNILQHSAPVPYASLFLVSDEMNFVNSVRFAQAEYSKFKNKFLELSTTLPLDSGDPISAVDTILSKMNEFKNTAFPWYHSDMVPYGINKNILDVPVFDPLVRLYEISGVFNDKELSNRAVLVYLDTHPSAVFVNGSLNNIIYVDSEILNRPAYITPTGVIFETGMIIRFGSFVYPAAYQNKTCQVFGVGSQISLKFISNQAQLLKDVDFVFSPSLPAIYVTDRVKLDVGYRLTVVEYVNTDGSYVPETPTKLGLYPKFTPEKIEDNTYQTTINVIVGHDGSRTPAFEDFRDDFLLELERRIYNNIKVDYEKTLFDPYDVLPGKFRSSDYSLDEFNHIISSGFLNWVGSNNIDYAANSTFSSSDQFTWNYSSFFDRVDGEQLQGSWRAIYRYFYDTETPHTTPWEMLGFSEMPVWWPYYYGPAPYTGGNYVLWDDLSKGKIADGYRKGIDPRFARPSLTSIIPVDENGFLKNPVEVLTRGVNAKYASSSWAIGQYGPVESAWRKSSDYAYCLQIAMALCKPAMYFGTMIDTTNYNYNTDLNQYVYSGFNHISQEDILVNGVNNNGVVTRSSGYINWISDYLIHQGMDSSKLVTTLKSFLVNLSYKVGGFTDKRYLQLLAEQYSPSSINDTIAIPDENYSIHLNKSTPLQRIVYSAVIIEKTDTGYTVKGYDLSNPYFVIIPSVANGNSTKITVLDDSATIFFDYQNLKITVPYGYEFNSSQQIVDFLISYERFLNASGFVFTQTDETLAEVKNWTLSAKEFLFWTQQGWPAGSILILSPVAGSLDVFTNGMVVDEIADSVYGTKVVDQNFRMVRNYEYKVMRTATEFNVSILDGQIIGLAELNLVQYEHVLTFDNTTVFNDIIYKPELGNRQFRLKMIGQKTDNWDGSLSAPGFIYNSDIVDIWNSGKDYNKGDLVKYKSEYYVALDRLAASDVFDFSKWKYVDASTIKTGLLPNFSFIAKQAESYYDNYYEMVDSNHASFEGGMNSNQSHYGYGLIGFKRRQYLDDLGLSDATQVELYKGYIAQKGTPNAVKALTTTQFNNISGEINFYDEWAVRVGEYGALDSNKFVEVILDEKTYATNLQTLEFVNDYSGDGLSVFGPTNLYKKSGVYTGNIALERTDKSDYTQDIPYAGFVNLADVDTTIYDLSNYKALNDKIGSMGSGYTIWCAKDFSKQWNVYRVTETNNFVVAASNALDGYVSIKCQNAHRLIINDIVLIKNFGAKVDGFYQVQKIVDKFSFLIEASDLFTESTTSILGNGFLLTLNSLRFKYMENVRLYTPPHGWHARTDTSSGEKVWIEHVPPSNQWGVFEKTYPYIYAQSVVKPAQEYEWLNSVKPKNDGYGSALKMNDSATVFAVSSPTNTTSYTYGNVQYDTRYGSVDVFAKAYANEFEHYSTIIPETLITEGFGYSLDLTDDYLVIGSPDSENNRGHLHIYAKDSSTADFSLIQILRGNASSRLGHTVSFSRDSLWLYAGCPATGDVYAYSLDPTVQNNKSIITVGITIDNLNHAEFISSADIEWTPYNEYYTVVSIQGIVFVPGVDYTISGSTIQFVTSSNTWQSLFGIISGYTVTSYGNFKTVIEVVVSQTECYTLVDTIHSPGPLTEEFGFALSVSAEGAQVGVGAPGADVLLNGVTLPNAGKVYVYDRSIEAFKSIEGLTRYTVTNSIKSVYRVAIDGVPKPLSEYTTAFGLNYVDFITVPDLGSTVVIETNKFNLLQELIGSDPQKNGRHGTSLTICSFNCAIYVGAPGFNTITGFQNRPANAAIVPFVEEGTISSTGAVFKNHNQGRLYGTIAGRLKRNPTVTVGDSIRLNDFEVVFTGFNTYINSIGTTINEIAVSQPIVVHEYDFITQPSTGAHAFVAESSGGNLVSTISISQFTTEYTLFLSGNITANIGDVISAYSGANVLVIQSVVDQSIVNAVPYYGEFTQTSLPISINDVEVANVITLDVQTIVSNKFDFGSGNLLINGQPIYDNYLNPIYTHPVADLASVVSDINAKQILGITAKIEAETLETTYYYNPSIATWSTSNSEVLDNVIITYLNNMRSISSTDTVYIPFGVYYKDITGKIWYHENGIQVVDSYFSAVLDLEPYLRLNSQSTVARNKMRVLSGIGTSIHDLGLEVFVQMQIITAPTNRENERFGTRVVLNKQAHALCISSKIGSSLIDTSFDGSLTYFDSRITDFKEFKDSSGSAYLYELYDDPRDSVELPGRYAFTQQIYPPNHISSGDQYGTASDIIGDYIIISAPNDIATSGNSIIGTGTVFIFENATGEFGWQQIASQNPKVDIETVSRIYLYDRIKNQIIQNLQFIDPMKGKVVGQADEEITYKSALDPAVYNTTTRTDVNSSSMGYWGAVQLYQIWWNLDTVRYIDYEQGDLLYRSSNWGRLFPGSTIDIFEWTASDVLPSKYVASGYDGTPLYSDDSAYVEIVTVDAVSGTFVTTYYFWVKNKNSLTQINGNRRLTTSIIANLIENPLGQNVPFAALIAKNAFAFNNISQFLSDNYTVLHIEYGSQNTNIIHSEYQLIHNAYDTVYPNAIIEKLVDSLAGIDIYGAPVPDPKLSEADKYGISIRPRQTMFADSHGALTLVIEFIDNVLKNNLVSDLIGVNRLFTYDYPPIPPYTTVTTAIPVEGLSFNYIDVESEINGQSVVYSYQNQIYSSNTVGGIPNEVLNSSIAIKFVDGLVVKFGNYVIPEFYQNKTFIVSGSGSYINLNSYSRVWDTLLPAYEALQFDDISTYNVGHRVLVLTDSTIDGLWSIYVKTSDNQWHLDANQGYNTQIYWNYLDWYSPGYDSSIKIDYITPTNATLETLTYKVGDIIKVLNNGAGKWILYEVIPSTNGSKSTELKTIALQDGTIKLHSDLGDYISANLGFDNQSYDDKRYDQNPNLELRALLNGILSAANQQPGLNFRASVSDLFFRLMNYIHTEQKYVDWIFKTSFIRVIHKLRSLVQSPTFIKDNQTYYEEYINEVKPYKTKIREYVLDYSGDDIFEGSIADFDLPPYYDKTLKMIRSPNGDYPEIDSEIYTQFPYNMWYENRTYQIGSIVMVSPGQNYTSVPTVEIIGDCTVPARAHAVIDVTLGIITEFVLDYPGYGYTGNITVQVVGGNGIGAQAYCVLAKNQVRSIATKIKFDRIAYRPSIPHWQPNTVYAAFDTVIHNNSVYMIPPLGYTSGSVFDPTPGSIDTLSVYPLLDVGNAVVWEPNNTYMRGQYVKIQDSNPYTNSVTEVYYRVTTAVYTSGDIFDPTPGSMDMTSIVATPLITEAAPWTPNTSYQLGQTIYVDFPYTIPVYFVVSSIPTYTSGEIFSPIDMASLTVIGPVNLVGTLPGAVVWTPDTTYYAGTYLIVDISNFERVHFAVISSPYKSGEIFGTTLVPFPVSIPSTTSHSPVAITPEQLRTVIATGVPTIPSSSLTQEENILLLLDYVSNNIISSSISSTNSFNASTVLSLLNTYSLTKPSMGALDRISAYYSSSGSMPVVETIKVQLMTANTTVGSNKIYIVSEAMAALSANVDATITTSEFIDSVKDIKRGMFISGVSSSNQIISGIANTNEVLSATIIDVVANVSARTSYIVVDRPQNISANVLISAQYNNMTQLMSGIEYPYSQLIGPRFEDTPAFDLGPRFGKGGFDSGEMLENGKPKLSDSEYDSIFQSSYENPLDGTRAEDINVLGGAYVDTASSHAPEELIPGITKDSLNMEVYTTITTTYVYSTYEANNETFDITDPTLQLIVVDEGGDSTLSWANAYPINKTGLTGNLYAFSGNILPQIYSVYPGNGTVAVYLEQPSTGSLVRVDGASTTANTIAYRAVDSSLYHQFEPAYSGISYYLIGGSSFALMDTPLFMTDSTISVNDATYLILPDRKYAVPGEVYINGEKITYYRNYSREVQNIVQGSTAIYNEGSAISYGNCLIVADEFYANAGSIINQDISGANAVVLFDSQIQTVVEVSYINDKFFIDANLTIKDSNSNTVGNIHSNIVGKQGNTIVFNGNIVGNLSVGGYITNQSWDVNVRVVSQPIVRTSILVGYPSLTFSTGLGNLYITDGYEGNIVTSISSDIASVDYGYYLTTANVIGFRTESVQNFALNNVNVLGQIRRGAEGTGTPNMHDIHSSVVDASSYHRVPQVALSPNVVPQGTSLKVVDKRSWWLVLNDNIPDAIFDLLPYNMIPSGTYLATNDGTTVVVLTGLSKNDTRKDRILVRSVTSDDRPNFPGSNMYLNAEDAFSAIYPLTSMIPQHVLALSLNPLLPPIPLYVFVKGEVVAGTRVQSYGNVAFTSESILMSTNMWNHLSLGSQTLLDGYGFGSGAKSSWTPQETFLWAEPWK